MSLAHTSQRTVQEWIIAFHKCPVPIAPFHVSGREASLYPGLRDILECLPADVPTHIETNLVGHPSSWLNETTAPRVRRVLCSLHFDPRDERGSRFWEHVEYVRDIAPQASCVVSMVITQQTRQDTSSLVRAMAQARGCEYLTSMFDETYLFRNRPVPTRGYCEQCYAGMHKLAVMPDGTVYRCLAHAYFDLSPLGNVIDDGWGVLLDAPATCDVTPCMCDGGYAQFRNAAGDVVPWTEVPLLEGGVL